MTEKGSPILLLLLLGLLYWASIPTVPDPTQCDIIEDSAPLIEEVAQAKDSMILDAAKDAAVSISLARSLAENHIADANKMVDPQPSPSDKPHEKSKREILIFVSKNCPPCEKWKRCEMQRFMDAGWSVGIVDQHSYGITPTFEIESGDKKVTRTGYTTLEQAVEAVR
jgi:hypothetical protein